MKVNLKYTIYRKKNCLALKIDCGAILIIQSWINSMDYSIHSTLYLNIERKFVESSLVQHFLNKITLINGSDR